MKFYLGILVGAVAIFFLGFAVWGLLAMRIGMFKALSIDGTALPAVLESKLETGVYLYPFPDLKANEFTGEAKEAYEKALDEKMKQGPLLRLVVNTQGRPRVDLDSMKLGFLHILLATAIVATLTRCVLSWATFKARYAFIVALGAFAAIWVDLSPAIWMAAPWDYQLYTAGYDIGAWILAGLPIAWGTGGKITV